MKQTNKNNQHCHSLTNGSTPTCHSLSKSHLRNKESMPYAHAQGMTGETGRSLVEMLGVLAIIGVLSVGGIAGYTTAMNKHRANTLLDEVSKRAIVASPQFLRGSSSVSLSEFKNPEGYTFGIDTTGLSEQFYITIATTNPNYADICKQMKNTASMASSIKKIDDGCTKILFNTDLSNTPRASDNNGNPDACGTDNTYCSYTGVCMAGKDQECACKADEADSCKTCDTTTGQYVADDEKDGNACDYDGGTGNGKCSAGTCGPAEIQCTGSGNGCQKCDTSTGEWVTDESKENGNYCWATSDLFGSQGSFQCCVNGAPGMTEALCIDSRCLELSGFIRITGISQNYCLCECFTADTPIMLANGTCKRADEITYDDELLVWNFDEGKFDKAKALWIKKIEEASSYNYIRFSDGSVLKTVNDHRIFNREAGKFTSTMSDETPVGTHTLNAKGEWVELVEKKVISEQVNFCNIITEKHLNCFAGNVLTSCRLNNLYPIKDMKFVKDDRKIVPYSEFTELPRKWYDGLRLGEQPVDINRDHAYDHGDRSVLDYAKRLMANAQ